MDSLNLLLLDLDDQTVQRATAISREIRSCRDLAKRPMFAANGFAYRYGGKSPSSCPDNADGIVIVKEFGRN
jgi:hypothetical protein